MKIHHDAPEAAKIMCIKEEAPGISSFALEFSGWDRVRPGQFVKLYVPDRWEVPISVAGAEPGFIILTVARVGRVTRALFGASPGDTLGVRGPYGRPWPLKLLWGNRVLVIAGGVGLAPVRLLVSALAGPRLTLLYGAREPSLLLYGNEYRDWRGAGVDLRLTVDRADDGWDGNVGVVTTLMSEELVRSHDYAVVAGPPIMMFFTTKTLVDMGMAPGRVFVTLENHMKCGIGLCGHCRIGDKYVCVDGPVFSLDEVHALERIAAGEVF